MADNNFIPVFPTNRGNQADRSGRNTTGARRSKEHASRAQDTNVHGRKKGGAGRERRRYKPRGKSGDAALAMDLANAKEEVAGEFDALRAQIANIKEMKATKEEEEAEEYKELVRDEVFRNLMQLNIEFVSRRTSYSTSTWKIVLNVIINVICILFGWFYLQLGVVDILFLYFICQCLAFVEAELVLRPIGILEMFNSPLYNRLCAFVTAGCWLFFGLACFGSERFIPKIIDFDGQETNLVPLDQFVSVRVSRINLLHSVMLVGAPALFFLYSVFISICSRAGEIGIYVVKDSIFGWFIDIGIVTAEKWNNPVPLFRNMDIGPDLRPNAQKHIKLTDPEAKFRLDYRMVERSEFRMLYRQFFDTGVNYLVEHTTNNIFVTLEASFSLLCELSDYDVCGLESNHLIARERITSKARIAERSVNINKYSAQMSNIYAHTTLVALALWHKRRQGLYGLPNFD